MYYGEFLKMLPMPSCFFPALLLLLLSVGCKAKISQDSISPGRISTQFSDFQISYSLNTPTASWSLPNELMEISGISLSADGTTLLAVQDELGLLYWINKETGTLIRKAEFWKEGDYEDIEVTSGAIYIVKSTGTLYRIQHAGEADQMVDKFNTSLNNTKADVEGLCFDPAGNRLLLACKAPSGTSNVDSLERNIFAFDPITQALSEKPVFSIRQADVQAYLKATADDPATAKIAAYFNKEKKEAFPLTPSAIAVHPLSGHLYLCSSGGRLLVVLDVKGAILHISKLDKSLLPQPEGMCFDQNGDLYLSSEGNDGPATLVKYAFIKQ